MVGGSPPTPPQQPVERGGCILWLWSYDFIAKKQQQQQQQQISHEKSPWNGPVNLDLHDRRLITFNPFMFFKFMQIIRKMESQVLEILDSLQIYTI